MVASACVALLPAPAVGAGDPPGAAGAKAARTVAVDADCPGLPVRVVAPGPRAHREACAGAGDAVRFLAAAGVRVDSALTLRIVDVLPQPVSDTAGGCYMHASQVAYVRTLSRCTPDATPFGLPVDAALYRSIIVHEVAHAIAGASFADRRPPVVAHEYVAYVTQLATMPDALRRKILRRHADVTYTSADQLNTMVFMMDPARFAVLAWLHHQRQGAAFLRAAIAGTAFPPDDIYGPR